MSEATPSSHDLEAEVRAALVAFLRTGALPGAEAVEASLAYLGDDFTDVVVFRRRHIGRGMREEISVKNTNDFSERLHVGLEYTFDDLFALRGGYRVNYAEGNWSVGAGLTPTVGAMRMRLDYAYVGYEFLTAPHRLSVGFAF